MYYAYKYRLKPSDAHREELDRHRDICRQLYNHALYRFNQIPKDAGTLNQRVRSVRDELPALKVWWDGLSDVYSTVLQTTVMRIEQNIKSLGKLKQNGYGVGHLTWKPPREFRSFTYSHSGFKLDKKGGQTVLSLSKLADVPIRLHREIPDDAKLKQVTLKKEPTGEWFATFGVEVDREPPEPPENPGRCVGIDVGILSYTHDSDGFSVGPLDLSEERERLEREQRKLSRKEHGSANYRTQQRVVARRHADLKRKRRDFLHRLSAYYAREYDLVAVEDLDAKGLMELPSNSRNRASASWGTFLRMLEYKCDREGTHFVAVDPRGTTKECSQCGVSTDKPLWVREHSCPSCGFEADRDANAALNILARGLDHVGVVHSDSMPVETALATGTTAVPAQRVMEAGSPALTERTAQAVNE
ncbi:RNA-guided endonuclease InsQ/TnpB family protein [Halegenticoccus tardaugens]|uniref:RNA-guided endonuclease InsQ/TnpB family protein n=1 Tax=Halegenticoccus tardaugens TaxID=2071624 RepID=UPI00100AF729|nr:RNA-guided endonuclease TnpB family protein [Halegenticoccus tardaugens]